MAIIPISFSVFKFSFDYQDSDSKGKYGIFTFSAQVLFLCKKVLITPCYVVMVVQKSCEGKKKLSETMHTPGEML